MKRKTAIKNSVVKLPGLVTPEGGISVTEDNTLVVSLVNIAEEGLVSNQSNIKISKIL